jgi:hypothetical protein
VGMTAAAVFRFTADGDPQRHLRCARLLDPDNALNTRDATPDQAGDAVYAATVRLMEQVRASAVSPTRTLNRYYSLYA